MDQHFGFQLKGFGGRFSSKGKRPALKHFVILADGAGSSRNPGSSGRGQGLPSVLGKSRPEVALSTKQMQLVELGLLAPLLQYPVFAKLRFTQRVQHLAFTLFLLEARHLLRDRRLQLL